MSSLQQIYVTEAQARIISDAREQIEKYKAMSFDEREKHFKELGTQLTVNQGRMTAECAFELQGEMIAILMYGAEVEYPKL